MEQFPVEVNTASKEALLRVPGIGVNSANRIITARRAAKLDFEGLKKIGVVLKRAQYFITCGGRAAQGLKFKNDSILYALVSEKCRGMLPSEQLEQLSLFDFQLTREDVVQCLSGQI